MSATQETTISESFNAGIDNLAAAADRMLSLPLFIVLPVLTGVAIMVTLLVSKRSSPPSPGFGAASPPSPGSGAASPPLLRGSARHGRWTRILIPVYALLALVAVSFVSDRRVARLNQRVAELQVTTSRLAARQVVRSPGAVPGQPGVEGKLHFDEEAAAAYLKGKIPGMTFQSRPYNDAADYVQLHSRTGVRLEAHLVVIDLSSPGVQVKLQANLNEKTYTSDFARANDCSIAINGEAGMSPGANSGLGTWSGHMMIDGRSVLKESKGNPRPFLSFDQEGRPTFTAMAASSRALPPSAHNVIWGRWDAVTNGVVQTADERNRQPRTAMGIDKTGTLLFLLVADGRQPAYSVGLSRAEVGYILAAFGASDGMLCDEGGSSCLYLDQIPGIANVPSDSGNSERFTYTHFGVAFGAASGERGGP